MSKTILGANSKPLAQVATEGNIYQGDNVGMYLVITYDYLWIIVL